MADQVDFGLFPIGLTRTIPPSDLCFPILREVHSSAPCRVCHSHAAYDVAITSDRIRRDCRSCGAFVAFVDGLDDAAVIHTYDPPVTFHSRHRLIGRK